MIFVPKIIRANSKTLLQIDPELFVTYDSGLRMSVVTNVNSKYPLAESAVGLKELIDEVIANAPGGVESKVQTTLIYSHIIQTVMPYDKFWKIFIYNPGLVLEFINSIVSDIYPNTVIDTTIIDVWNGITSDEDNKRHSNDVIHSCYLDLQINEQVYVKVENDQVTVSRCEDSKERFKLSRYNLAGSNGISRELFKHCIPSLAYLVSAKMLIGKLEQLESNTKISSNSIHRLEEVLNSTK